MLIRRFLLFIVDAKFRQSRSLKNRLAENRTVEIQMTRSAKIGITGGKLKSPIQQNMRCGMLTTEYTESTKLSLNSQMFIRCFLQFVGDILMPPPRNSFFEKRTSDEVGNPFVSKSENLGGRSSG
jgi:hypothetical protein